MRVASYKMEQKLKFLGRKQNIRIFPENLSPNRNYRMAPKMNSTRNLQNNNRGNVIQETVIRGDDFQDDEIPRSEIRGGEIRGGEIRGSESSPNQEIGKNITNNKKLQKRYYGEQSVKYDHKFVAIWYRYLNLKNKFLMFPRSSK